ncbi:alpha/beta hydrolase family esterase [Catenuloplanes atrovinosus]|uniref:Polyhydroxybutyrate depolymerase n=1 Tax=Catenuloplanes atrovinosus TaxID=137266 RepID=A0AAE3YP26_9ACTN|nr:hypothetical protein [Catenuloplanes atrovinosus]MDR7277388.1 polyhydroxybutyrate depolymerase [Catenuloplanes atrovinosus]
MKTDDPHTVRLSSASIEAGGRTRTYTLATPEGGFDRLLLAFHGSRLNAARFRAFTGNALDTVRGTAVAYLDGFRGNWNDARAGSRFPARTHGIDDVAFADAVASRVGEGRPVYAVGYSNGGGMVIRLLHERPDLIAGGAVIAAGQPAPDNFLLRDDDLPIEPRPVMIIHGTRDPVVPYDGGQLALWARYLFRAHGALLSAPDTAAYFAARNGITAAPVTTSLTAEVTRTDHHQDGHEPVRLYTVHGGGHTIPGPVPSPALIGRTTRDLHTGPAIEDFFGF